MNLLREADARYVAAATPNLTRVPVQDPAVEACTAAATALVRLIDDAGRPPEWSSARNAATALRWSLVTRPRLSSDSPDGWETQVRELRSELRRAARTASAELHALETLVDSASSLQGDDELAEQIAASVRAVPGTTCVVLVNAAARTSAETVLGERLPGAAFLTPRQFSVGGIWTRAVVVGVSAWYPDTVFTAPRAEQTVLVHHRWLHDQAEVPGLFGTAASHALAVPLPQQNIPRFGHETIQPPVQQLDWTSIEPIGGQPTDSDPTDDVPARLILLAGGFGFYLEEDADRIRGLDPSRSAGKWIRQLPVAGIGPDTVVILRRAGSERELLQPRINDLLGSDGPHVRARQAEWKGMLAERLGAGDIRGLRRALDMTDLTLQYARYWASSVSIFPRPRTFRRLLEYLRVPDPEAYVTAARTLFNAHLGAGKQLSKELEALVDDSVVLALESSDSVTLSLGEGSAATQITLFRVIAVCPHTVTIPAAALRWSLRMKGTQWLG